MGSGAAGAAILGIILVLAPFILGIVAVAAGLVARKRIRRSGGELRGEGIAVAGVILGAISLAGGLGLIALGIAGWAAGSRAPQNPGFNVQTFPAPPPVRAVPVPLAPPTPDAADDPFEEEIIEEEGGD